MPTPWGLHHLSEIGKGVRNETSRIGTPCFDGWQNVKENKSNFQSVSASRPKPTRKPSRAEQCATVLSWCIRRHVLSKNSTR